MNYRLIVLTHGASETLEETLRSFAAHVQPAPIESLLVYDGPQDQMPEIPREISRMPGWRIWNAAPAPGGFCAATRVAWEHASEDAGWGVKGDIPYVFWLEHDFRFVRDVDLRWFADVLDEHPLLAQMALVRDAANEEEEAAGGWLRRHGADIDAAAMYDPGEGQPYEVWLAHEITFTTNPSLMRVGFMADNPWPEYERQCEGRFSADLRARGYSFAAWGTGDVYVEHIGQRTGFGY